MMLTSVVSLPKTIFKKQNAHVGLVQTVVLEERMNKPKYEMIQDESQLEIPQYIDEPKYVRNKKCGLWSILFRMAGLDLAVLCRCLHCCCGGMKVIASITT